jgi:hypothetical protein
MALSLFIAAAGCAVTACNSASHLSPTSVTPQSLLARVRRANAQRPDAGIIHERYRTVSTDGDVALTDTYQVQSGMPLSDFRSTMIADGIRREQGRFFGRTWWRDPNGLVTPNAQYVTIFDRLLIRAAHQADSRVRVLGVTQTLPREYVLQITPDDKISQQRYIEATTYLLRKVVTRDYDGKIATVQYENYVRVGRNLLPSRIVMSNSLSTRVDVITLLHTERVPYHAALLSPPKSRTVFLPQYPLPATVNSLFGNTGILVRADIQGAPYWFKLDSGAGDIVLDRGLAERLGLHEFEKRMTSKGGKYQSSGAVLPRIDIGPVYATNVYVNVLPHDHVEQGLHVVGLLGCDFIAAQPIAIDFGKQSVTLLKTAPSLRDRHWRSVRTPLHGCTPSIDVLLNGWPVRLTLDLGSDGTIINPSLFRRIEPLEQPLETTVIHYVGGERLVADKYAISRAFAGTVDFSPLIATVVRNGRGQDLDRDGLLGRNALADYRLVLDYKDQRTLFQWNPLDDDSP